jgi:excinuclease ABC subunit C
MDAKDATATTDWNDLIDLMPDAADQDQPALVIPPDESRQERLQRLNEKAKRLTKDPGVYLMKDARGRVIYVGKSAVMRDRVSSYFQPSTKLEAKKAGLLDEVVDFDTLGADSEVEALLIENRLIKDIKPKFNTALMDDKTFPYLVVTMKDDFPGVYVTREPAKHKGAKVYGPFTSVWALKDAISMLQKAFKFRTCELDIKEGDEKRRFFRPCLLHAIKQCTAPCADRVKQDDYRGDVRRLLRFLDGDRAKLTKDLRRQMEQASSDMRFEEAAKLRDELKALSALGKRASKGTAEFWQPEAYTSSFVTDPARAVDELQKALNMDAAPRVVECFDIAHLQGGEMVGSKVSFIDGQPFKDGYRRYKIRHQQGNNDYLSLQEVISRRYREAAQGTELYPDLIVIDGGIGQLNSVMESFKLAELKPPMVVSISKQEELIHTNESREPVKLPRNHLGLKMLQYARDEAHRFAQHYHHILRRKAQLETDIKTGRRPPKPRQKRVELQQVDPIAKVVSDLDHLQQKFGNATKNSYD